MVDVVGDVIVVDVGVYCVGEVDCGGIFGQFYDVVFGCEYVDFVWEQVDFYVFDEFQ